MGNITVINANYDVKMAITWDMKNSLTHVSYNLVCKMSLTRLQRVFEMPIFKLITKIQVKVNRDNTRKRFYLCPHKIFKQNVR